MTSPSPKFSNVQVFLHWFSAIIIVWALISGFSVATFNVSAALKSSIAFINVSLTTVLIPFFLWRTVLACLRRRHVEKSCVRFAEQVAHWAHVVLYVLTWLVLATGVLMMDRPINVFNLVHLPAPLTDQALIQWMTTVHIWLCLVLGLMVGLHVAAVIKHQICGRNVLANMSWKRR